MKFGLSFLFVLVIGNTAFALAKWDAKCSIKDSSIRGLESVIVAGPLSDRNFRLRLMDHQGRQLETGACDFSGECYSKDWHGYNDVLEGLSVRVTLKSIKSLKMDVYSSISGSAKLECKIR